MDPKDPLESCPIEPTHRIRRSVLSRHLYRCLQNNPQAKTLELRRCPLNVVHLLDPCAYDHHVATCTSSVNVIEAMYVTEGVRQIGTVSIEEACKKESLVTIDEDWSGNNVQGGYNPEWNVENKNILRSSIGLSKAKRRQFKNSERMRIAKLENEGVIKKEEKTLDLNTPLRAPKNPAKAVSCLPKDKNTRSKQSSLEDLISKLKRATTEDNNCITERKYGSSSSNNSVKEEKFESKFCNKENNYNLPSENQNRSLNEFNLTHNNKTIVGTKTDFPEIKTKSKNDLSNGSKKCLNNNNNTMDKPITKSDSNIFGTHSHGTASKNGKKNNVELSKIETLKVASEPNLIQRDISEGKSNLMNVSSPNSTTSISKEAVPNNFMEVLKAELSSSNSVKSENISFKNPRCAAFFQNSKTERRVGCGRGFRTFFETLQKVENVKKDEPDCSSVFGYGEEEELDFEDVDLNMKKKL